MFRSFILSKEIALVQATVVVWIKDIGPIEKHNSIDVIKTKFETLCNQSVFVSRLLIQCPAITWTADELMLLVVLGTHTSEIWL